MSVDANAIFEEELAKRGLGFERDGENSYRLKIGEVSVTVSLENVRRDVERDGDPDAIRRFVTRVVQIGTAPVPPWTEASRRLFLSAEPSDHEFGDTIRSMVSKEVCRVLTLTDEEQGQVSWVTETMCADWGVSADRAVETAVRNQDGLLSGLRMEIEQIDGHKLGMVPLDSPFKASVIFAPALKDLVAADFGWPVWVVVPCRDFIYVMEEKSELVQRIGEVVVREFHSSGYPITTEVLRVSNDGIEAIGAFPK